MTSLSVVLLLSLLTGGCVSRDVVAVTTWEQRGETVGDLVYLYCNRAAPREKLIFAWGVERTAGPHRVLIVCDGSAAPLLRRAPDVR